MNKKLGAFLASMVLLALPVASLAVTVSGTPQPTPNQPIQISQIIDNVLNFIVWPLAVGAVIGLFMLAGMQFLTGHGEPGKMQEARRSVAWGVVGVIVMLLAFSII